MTIPFIPNTAPFTPEQRAWLNGYFVGLLSDARTQGSEPATEQSKAAAEPLLILFGSQTGTAEQIAKRVAKESSQHNIAPQVLELNAVAPTDLAKHNKLIIVTSTWGDGDPPDNAANFWTGLSRDSAPRLEHLGFAVLALGDRNYTDFCGAGRKMDERLEQLGARRLLPRADCDVDYEPTVKKWLTDLWVNLSLGHAAHQSKSVLVTAASVETDKPQWSRTNPFQARLLGSRVLNGAASAKETRHIEISLEESGLTYEPGDALGVYPRNCAEMVDELLGITGWSPEEQVKAPDGSAGPIREVLLGKCDLRKSSAVLLDALAKAEGCESFVDLLPPDKKEQLKEYLGEREVIDLLIDHPQFRPDPIEFVGMLGKLQPRLYSISSSLAAFPGQVHLTVGAVRYETRGRSRKGVCSTFLADRVCEGGTVPVFVQPSHGFKLPPDGGTRIIMVGPGTGIAPFRGFLHHRAATRAAGKNWLFFGDQQSSCDFLYRDEIEAFAKSRLLTRLETAFSRDQTEKVYVQHRMLENARELFDWLEQGAHFYVCGDASRMARDVDAALHQVIQKAGRSPEKAAEYVQALKAEKRYQRDVY